MLHYTLNTWALKYTAHTSIIAAYSHTKTFIELPIRSDLTVAAFNCCTNRYQTAKQYRIKIQNKTFFINEYSDIISCIDNVTKFITSNLYLIFGKLRSFISQSQGHAKSNESQHETQAEDLMTNSEDTDNYGDQTNEDTPIYSVPSAK